MPNTGHYTRCPYFVSEYRKTISCEDVCRTYDSPKSKESWMYMYCDSWDWMRCPYAADMEEAYRRFEKGDKMAVENQEKTALRKEIMSLQRKLGRRDKRIERMQKKIDSLRAVNQSLINVNATEETKNRNLFQRYKDLSDRMAKYEEKVSGQVMQLSDTYEARIAYLMDTYSNGILYESDVADWAKDKEYAIVYAMDEDDEYARPCFKVIFREEGEEADEHSEDIQTDVQEGQEVRQSESAD